MTEIDSSGWSGDGSFTQLLIDTLRQMPEVDAVRVEDAPASRAESGYNFIANEMFVSFRADTVRVPRRMFGLIPFSRRELVERMKLEDLGAVFGRNPAIGEPDYADEGMIQYLRTERVVAPYQTRGVKVIELVRIYRAGPIPR